MRIRITPAGRRREARLRRDRLTVFLPDAASPGSQSEMARLRGSPIGARSPRPHPAPTGLVRFRGAWTRFGTRLLLAAILIATAAPGCSATTETKGSPADAVGRPVRVGLSLNSTAASEPFPKAAEWPCDRRHPSLDARSPLRGHLTQLDSDGREEAGFVMGQSLVCLDVASDGQRGEIRWQTELPARIGPPSLALLERDGPLSLLLVGEDGYVYCIQ